jgi:hypothetical protein
VLETADPLYFTLGQPARLLTLVRLIVLIRGSVPVDQLVTNMFDTQAFLGGVARLSPAG